MIFSEWKLAWRIPMLFSSFSRNKGSLRNFQVFSTLYGVSFVFRWIASYFCAWPYRLYIKLVLPYNWNIEYEKKKFISKVVLTQLIMKRYLPTPKSLHAIRHRRLWYSLSTHFDLLLEPSPRSLFHVYFNNNNNNNKQKNTGFV